MGKKYSLKRKRHYCNNGIVNKYWYDDTGIPEGFVDGKLPFTEEQKKKRKENTEATNLKRYGVKNTFNIPEVLEKAHSPEVIKIQKENREKTKLEKYGDANWSNPIQAQQTMNDLYGGVLHGSPITSAKIDATVEKIYGYKKSHFNAIYSFDNEEFDSSWELYYYIYCKDHNINIKRSQDRLSYEFNNKTYYYEPDFIINNEYIEIKGDQFLDREGNLKDLFSIGKDKINAKNQCMIDNKVKILSHKELKPIIDEVIDLYGKNYIDQFKIKTW